MHDLSDSVSVHRVSYIGLEDEWPGNRAPDPEGSLRPPRGFAARKTPSGAQPHGWWKSNPESFPFSIMFQRAKICQNGGYTTIRTDSEKLENYIDIIYRNIYKFAAGSCYPGYTFHD